MVLGPGREKISFGQQLNAGLGNALKMGQQKMQEYQQKEAYKKLGIPEGTPSKLAEIYAAENLKGQAKEKNFANELEKQRREHEFKAAAKASELQGKEQEKEAPFQAGLDALEQMRILRKKGNLGFFSSLTGNFSPETRKDRGEYEQLGKSLISLASNIPIRNQREFTTLAEKIYDSSITDAEAEGILNAMERIISNSMRGGEGIGASLIADQPSQGKPKGKPKEKPPLLSFHR